MLFIVVRIKKVDMGGYNGRDHHPTPDMEGRYVRVTNLDTVPPATEDATEEPLHIFYGVIVDANGDDIEDGKVQLMEHEIEVDNNVPTLFHEVRVR